jgi:hypothetical protein
MTHGWPSACPHCAPPPGPFDDPSLPASRPAGDLTRPALGASGDGDHRQPGARDIGRFWEKVDRRGFFDCWPWLGVRDHKGYGQFSTGGRAGGMHGAHRFAVQLTGATIPAGMFVLHHCDNPPCVNPAHLYVGTNADNMRDMWARGRAPRQTNPRQFCRNGHAYRDTAVVYADGIRRCLECRRLRHQARRLASSSAVHGVGRQSGVRDGASPEMPDRGKAGVSTVAAVGRSSPRTPTAATSGL